METRRKEIGRQIKVARRIKKFRSQRAFAEHIGVHENSVANAEVGSDRIGQAVFAAIETGLGWPLGSIEAYIAGAGPAPWTQSGTSPVPAADLAWPTDEQIIAMSVPELREFSFKVQGTSGPQAAEDWLYHALGVRRDARRKPPIRQPSEA